MAKFHMLASVDFGNSPFILDFCSHPRGEHTGEETAGRAGEGSKAGEVTGVTHDIEQSNLSCRNRLRLQPLLSAALQVKQGYWGTPAHLQLSLLET